MFVIYSDTGSIMGTMIGPDESYGDILDNEGRKWLFLEGATSLDPLLNHVDVVAKAIAPNRAINLTASKAVIAADNIDTSTIAGVPKGAAVNVLCNGVPVLGEIVEDGVIEFTAAAPGAYKITVSCPTYNPAVVEIVAS